MRVRTEAEVVKRALSVIEEYKQDPNEIKKLEIGERVATRRILRNLEKLLEPYKNSQEIATPAGLRKLEHFLREESELTGTPFLFCYQPHEIANSALIALAEELATVFPYTALQLLLPEVSIPKHFKTKDYNNFVITPDGYFIDVLEKLDEIRKDPNHQYKDPAGFDFDPDLLREHSTVAGTYATLLCRLDKRSKDDEIAACDKARRELADFIKEGEFYQREHPAHGEAGRKRLMQLNTKKVKTIYQLAEFLDANLSRDEWRVFLSSMDHYDLLQITIPKSIAIQTKDQTDPLYKSELTASALPIIYELASGLTVWPHSDNIKRALAFIMNFVYHQVRSDAPERTGTFDFGRGFTKTQVKDQTNAMMDFLLGDQHMLDLEDYLAIKVAEGKILAINSSTCLALKNKILEAGKLCQPKAEVNPEPQTVDVQTSLMPSPKLTQ